MTAADKPREPATVRAFADLATQYWHPIYRFLVTLVGNASLAEELAQQAYLQAWQAWPSFPSDGNAKAWLFQIAANLGRDQLRRGRRLRMESLGVLEDAESNQAELIDPSPGPTWGIELAEQAGLAKLALETLTPLTRMVFLLRVEGDLPYADVAEIAGVTEQSARWHMRHAREALQEKLRDQT